MGRKKRRRICLAILTAIIMVVGCRQDMTLQAAETWKWPVPSSTKVNQYWSSAHGAIDIGGTKGCDIVASRSGTVYKVLKNGVSYDNWIGYGNGVVINHGDGYYSHYAHMDSTCVTEGQYVTQGQKLGTMGETGNATGVHLHFAVKTGEKAPYGGATGSINNDPGSFYSDIGSSSTSTSTISWTTSVSDKTGTNAKVSARITVPSTVQFQWAGCNFYDNRGNMIAQAGETTSVKGTYMNIWYNITEETWNNISLSPGITYKYQFYATYGSVDHFSPMYTFTTTGTHTHSYTSVVTTEATCQKTGVRKYTCTNTHCGYSYEQTIDKTAHSTVTDAAVAATCETAGKTAGSHCKTCGTVITQQTEVPALGHNWVSTITKKATVFSSGTKILTCNRCGTKTSQTIAKLTPVLRLSATSVTIKKNKTRTITVTELANGDSVKSWSSANKKIATVSSKGKITAKKKGTTSITVKLKSGKTGKVKVTVK